jgi:hypothetical protein
MHAMLQCSSTAPLQSDQFSNTCWSALYSSQAIKAVSCFQTWKRANKHQQCVVGRISVAAVGVDTAWCWLGGCTAAWAVSSPKG